MSQPDRGNAYNLGWNAQLDGKGCDDNPWTECSDPGWWWMQGLTDCEKACDGLGTENVERRP